MSTLLRQMMEDSPAGLWTLEEQSGTSFADATGHNLVGTGTGLTMAYGPIFGSTMYPRWDADADNVQIANNALLNPTTAITLETCYSDEAFPVSTERPLIHKAFTSHVAPYYQYNWTLYRPASGTTYQFSFYMANAGGLTNTAANLPLYTIGRHHAAVTWDGANVRYYLDGSQVDTDKPQAGAMVTYATPLRLGSYTNVAIGWRGQLGYSAVYGSALSAARIKAHYQAAIRSGVMVG